MFIPEFRRPAIWWEHLWFAPVPCASVRIFRAAHGLTLLIFLAAWWRSAPEWIGDSGFHFPDEIMPPLQTSFLPLFGALQFGCIILFVIGWRVRWTAAITWLLLLWVTLIDRPAAFSINNIFLFTFAVMTVFPTEAPSGRIAAAPVRLLQAAMLAIYFSSGWHKAVYGDWLSSPVVLEEILKGVFRTDFAAWALRTLPPSAWTAAQYGTLAFELFSPVLFLSRRLRCVAIAIGCAFHLGIALCMEQLIYFSLQMMSFYLLFVPPLCDFLPNWIRQPDVVSRAIPRRKDLRPAPGERMSGTARIRGSAG